MTTTKIKYKILTSKDPESLQKLTNEFLGSQVETLVNLGSITISNTNWYLGVTYEPKVTQGKPLFEASDTTLETAAQSTTIPEPKTTKVPVKRKTTRGKK